MRESWKCKENHKSGSGITEVNNNKKSFHEEASNKVYRRYNMIRSKKFPLDLETKSKSKSKSKSWLQSSEG